MANQQPVGGAVQEAAALRIVKRLAADGFRALYAGGYVRDRLLGFGERGDIDIATNATPTTVSRLFDRTVGVGAHFGVVIVVEDGVAFEVATFRSDIGISDGRHPESVVFTDERTDALRRDFTINGMFYDPLADEVLDYVGGREDLGRRMIRAIGEPSQRFREDYLRLLRAIRFAARFGFEVELQTLRAIAESAPHIVEISAERIFQELDCMLRGRHADRAIGMLGETNLLAPVLPEVATLEGVPQPPQFHPEGDVLRHTLIALSLLSGPSQRLAWSALLHDIGKPLTMTTTDRIRFHNHQTVGAGMATRALERLRAPRALIDDVAACVENHMTFMNADKMRLATIKRLLARPTFDDELELHRVDCLASHGMLDNYEYLVGKRRELAEAEIKPVPLMSGRDLLDLGLRPGPLFGEILRAAYDLQLEVKLTTRDEALAWLKARCRDEVRGRVGNEGTE